MLQQSLRHDILTTLLLSHRLDEERPKGRLVVHRRQWLDGRPSRAQTDIDEISRGIVLRRRGPSVDHLLQRVEIVAHHIGAEHDEGSAQPIAHLAELTKGRISLSLRHPLPACARPSDVKRIVVSNSPWDDLLPCPHRRRRCL